MVNAINSNLNYLTTNLLIEKEYEDIKKNGRQNDYNFAVKNNRFALLKKSDSLLGRIWFQFQVLLGWIKTNQESINAVRLEINRIKNDFETQTILTLLVDSISPNVKEYKKDISCKKEPEEVFFESNELTLEEKDKLLRTINYKNQEIESLKNEITSININISKLDLSFTEQFEIQAVKKPKENDSIIAEENLKSDASVDIKDDEPLYDSDGYQIPDLVPVTREDLKKTNRNLYNSLVDAENKVILLEDKLLLEREACESKINELILDENIESVGVLKSRLKLASNRLHTLTETLNSLEKEVLDLKEQNALKDEEILGLRQSIKSDFIQQIQENDKLDQKNFAEELKGSSSSEDQEKSSQEENGWIPLNSLIRELSTDNFNKVPSQSSETETEITEDIIKDGLKTACISLSQKKEITKDIIKDGFSDTFLDTFEASMLGLQTALSL